LAPWRPPPGGATRGVDASIAALTSIIEPIMIIPVGVMVGTIILSMYLRMFKLLTLIK
jgi:type IV pilus assembly protein PilC